MLQRLSSTIDLLRCRQLAHLTLLLFARRWLYPDMLGDLDDRNDVMDVDVVERPAKRFKVHASACALRMLILKSSSGV